MEEIKKRYQQAAEEIRALEVTVTRANAEIDELGKERYELRSKWLGFLDDVNVNEDDMSDPKNWRVGDSIECIDEDIDDIGKIEKISKIEGGFIYRKKGLCDIENISKFWKFHSRPSKDEK